MKHLRFIALFGLLALLSCGQLRAQSSSSTMTVTATVLKAPNNMELSLADTVSVGTPGDASSFGQLTLSRPDSAGYLLRFSDMVEMREENGEIIKGRVTGRETSRQGDNISYEIMGDFQGVQGTRRASGGQITATIEYY